MNKLVYLALIGASSTQMINTQVGVCRQACGTSNSWSPCVIGCKMKQIGCSAQCGSDVGCMLKCVTSEEETNTQVGVCRQACGTSNSWSPCVIGCKMKQVGCSAQCGSNVGCMLKCVTSEEETNTQMGVCRQACGTSNSWSPCVIGCKVKQVGCSTQCGSDVGCMLKCVTSEEETNTQIGVCRQACGTSNSWSPCVIGCKIKQVGCSTQCGSDVGCMLKCVTSEEEVTEMLDVSMSRWAERRISQKGEAVGNAFEDITRGPRSRSEEEQMMRELNTLAQEVTGKSLEDFEKLANTRGSKYEQAAGAIVNSQSWNDAQRFSTEKVPRDSLAQKIYKDAMTLNKDVFGGYNSQYQYYERPTYQFDEIRTRPQNDDNMSRMERDQAEMNGAHINNDDLKDIAEDIEDIYNDFESFMDPNYGLQQEAIKLDAKIRFSPEMAALGGLIKEDLALFDITDQESFERNVGGAMWKLEQKAEKCPFVQRLEKTADRFIRAAAKEIQVGDLPTGQRMQWVNELAQELYEIMQMGDPVEGVEHFIDNALEEVFHEVARYMETVNRMEMEFGKDM